VDGIGILVVMAGVVGIIAALRRYGIGREPADGSDTPTWLESGSDATGVEYSADHSGDSDGGHGDDGGGHGGDAGGGDSGAGH
jgi:hypothetical protein